MADRKISELTNITGANLADGDELVVVDASASETKAITFGEFKNALDTSTGFVSITGDTMTGDLILNSDPSVALGAATKQYVDNEISGLVDSAPATLDTLNELAAALGDDANFSTTVTNSIATKLPLAGGTLTGTLNFGDNVKAQFGASADLQVYHTGSTSYIWEQGTGDLRIRGNQVRIEDDDGSTIALFQNNAGAQLRHNGTTVLDTNATGINVTGTVTADEAVYVEGSTPRVQIQDTDGTSQFSLLQQQGSDFFIRSRNNTADGGIIFAGYGGASTTNRMYIAPSGDISFYEDTGTTAKFFWDASAESLKLSSAKNHGAGVDTLLLENVNTGQPVALAFTAAADNDGSGNEGAIYFDAGATGIASDNQLQFNADHQTSTTPDMVITGSGNVGIGTASPSEKLDVNGTAKATTFELNNWTITESGGSLYFATGGTNKMKLDASGNLDVVGSVNANATIT